MTIKFDNYAIKLKSEEIRGVKYDLYSWVVFVDESDDVQNKIDYVEYLLDPSFPFPNRRIRNEHVKFYLKEKGYAGFTIDITVRFKDGSEEKTTYLLDINKYWPVIRRYIFNN